MALIPPKNGFNLFYGLAAYQYFDIQHQAMVHEIADLTDAEFASRSIPEWRADFLARYTIEPLHLFVTEVKFSYEAAMVAPISLMDWVPDVDPHRGDPPEPGYIVTVQYPFTGDDVMVYIRPERFPCRTYPATRVVAPVGNQKGMVEFKREFQAFRVPEEDTEWEAERLVMELSNHFHQLFSISAHNTREHNGHLLPLIDQALAERAEIDHP